MPASSGGMNCSSPQHRRDAIRQLANRSADGGNLGRRARSAGRHDDAEIAQHRRVSAAEIRAGLRDQHHGAACILVEPLHIQRH
jgi:hypothetical protein